MSKLKELKNIKIFNYVKFFTIVSCCTPFINKYEKSKLININILEACILSLINNGINLNVLEGFFLIIMLNKIKKKSHKKIFNLWVIIYFHWNMRFCKDIYYPLTISLGHNLPPLIYFFTDINNIKECIDYWCIVRGGSLLRTFFEIIFINHSKWENKNLNYKLSILSSIIFYYLKYNTLKKGVLLTNLLHIIFLLNKL